MREEGHQIAALSVQRRLGLAGDCGDEVACGPLSETGFGGVEEAWNVMGEMRVSPQASSGMDSSCESPRISPIRALRPQIRSIVYGRALAESLRDEGYTGNAISNLHDV